MTPCSANAEHVADEFGIELETEILQARDVGTAIVDEALEREVDLIVMGIGYKRKFGEFDMGHTAPYVLKNAPCRVWLARAAPGCAPRPSPPARRASTALRSARMFIIIMGCGRVGARLALMLTHAGHEVTSWTSSRRRSVASGRISRAPR